jgi:2,4-dienoyl-CoA reductase-like NADH-dependent reductase (Old Yellow Enzyme family)
VQANRAERIKAMFEPLRIRGVTLPNRFVMSPANRNAAPDGIPGEDIAQFYRRRVDGEVGLIVAGGVGIDHPASVGAGADRPCAIPVLHGPALAGWRRIAELVHAGGGKIVPQLWHQGVMRLPGTGYHPEAESSRPSGIWGPAGRRTRMKAEHVARLAVPGRELTDAEIVDIIEAYARSARNAVELGVDGIAIHGANGYLPDAFLWAETNMRTDRWGGNRRERTRFAVEVVRAVRRETGDALPIFFRFTQWKHQDRDARLADTPAELEDVLGPLSDAGVDVFDAGQFKFDTPAFAGSELNLAGWAKKLTGRFTMTVGSIGLSSGHWDPDVIGPAESVDNIDALLNRFERGEFDLAGIARSLLNDANWARTVRLGEPLKPFDHASVRTMN